MCTDVRNGRRTELASMGGAVARLGARHGVPVPAHDTVSACSPWPGSDDLARRRDRPRRAARRRPHGRGAGGLRRRGPADRPRIDDRRRGRRAPPPCRRPGPDPARPGGGPAAPDRPFDDHLRLLELAHVLGARFLLTVSEHPSHAGTVTDLARLAAAARGADTRIALEFMRFTEVRTLAAALSTLDDAGAGEAVVLVDALHLHRGGEGPEALAGVDRIGYLQLCDAPADAPDPPTWPTRPATTGSSRARASSRSAPPRARACRTAAVGRSPVGRPRARYGPAERAAPALTPRPAVLERAGAP